MCVERVGGFPTPPVSFRKFVSIQRPQKFGRPFLSLFESINNPSVMSLARPNNRGTQNSACLEKLRPIAETTGRLDSEYTGRLGPLYLFKNTEEKRVMFLGTFPFVPETRCLAHVMGLLIHRIDLVSSPEPHQSSLHPQNKQGICFPIFSASSSFCEDGICRKRF